MRFIDQTKIHRRFILLNSKLHENESLERRFQMDYCYAPILMVQVSSPTIESTHRLCLCH